MKKILSLLSVIALLNSCNYLSSPIVIVAIQDYTEDGTCIYTTNQSPLLYPNMKFLAPCGNWNVGDTIKLTK